MRDGSCMFVLDCDAKNTKWYHPSASYRPCLFLIRGRKTCLWILWRDYHQAILKWLYSLLSIILKCMHISSQEGSTIVFRYVFRLHWLLHLIVGDWEPFLLGICRRTSLICTVAGWIMAYHLQLKGQTEIINNSLETS